MRPKKNYRQKTIFAFLFLLLFFFGSGFFCLSFARLQPVYDNPGQGLFQCHSDDAIGADYVKGGGVIVFWGDLQPSGPSSLDRGAVNALIGQIRAGKKKYLHFEIYLAEDVGSHQVFPPWLNIPKVVFAGGSKTYPVNWNPVYQQYLRNFLTKLNNEFESSGIVSSIEFIEPAVGGQWGGAELWLPDSDLVPWLSAAGCNLNPPDYSCLGRNFTNGVMSVVDIYEESFPNIPMMFIQGSCSHPECGFSGTNTLLSKYGMKMMYKSAGIGHWQMGGCGTNGFFQWAAPQTKNSQEPWAASSLCGGPVNSFTPPNCPGGYAGAYQNSVEQERISYYCMYKQDLVCTNSTVLNTNRYIVADHMGAQISILSYSPNQATVSVGQPFTINFRFQNTGSATFLAPLKQGLNWRASSYKLFLDFEKTGGGGPTYTYAVPFDMQTSQWLPGARRSFEIDKQVLFNIPIILGGDLDTSVVSYNVYAGFVDPNGENKRFVLRNTDGRNDFQKRRYFLGMFTVTGKGMTPTPTIPLPTNLPTQTPIPGNPICPSTSCFCGTPNRVSIFWNVSPGANSYKIYRDDVYKETTSDLMYTDVVSCGVSYSYDVQPSPHTVLKYCEQNCTLRCACAEISGYPTPPTQPRSCGSLCTVGFPDPCRHNTDGCTRCVSGTCQRVAFPTLTATPTPNASVYCNSGGGIITSIGCIPFPNINDFTAWILARLIYVAVGVAFFLMAYGAFMITTARGDAKKVQAGVELITSAIAGILFIILSLLILKVVGVDILKIPGLFK